MVNGLLIFAICSLAPAQTIGGGITTHFKIFGEEPQGRFGWCVEGVGDISRDGCEDFMVGTPYQDASRGAAYLYSGFDGKLLAKWVGESIGDGFGHSLCGPGDLNSDGIPDLIVGAIRPSSGGRAYAYSGKDGTELFRIDSGPAGSLFGSACSPAGDVNQDSIPDFLIGAVGANSNRGIVYVCSGTGTIIRQHDGPLSGMLGDSLDGGADFDLDGVPDYIAGASSAYPGGRFYVYSGATGSVLWEHSGISRLGMSLSIVGDLDQDGVPEIAVGDPIVDIGGSIAVGAVFVYSYPTRAELFRFDGIFDREQYGTAVADAGDFDEDGIGDILIGAPSNGVVVPRPGRIEVRSGSTGQLLYGPTGSYPGDSFGDAVGSAFSLKGTKKTSILIGSFTDPNPPPSTEVGSVRAVGVSQFLFTTKDTFSVSQGGIVGFRLDFPASAGNEVYQLLASRTGTGPMMLGNLKVPLTRDSLTDSMLAGYYPPVLYLPVGLLDSKGDGLAWLMAGPGSLSAGLVGRRLWAAAVTIPLSGTWHFSSMAAVLDFLP